MKDSVQARRAPQLIEQLLAEINLPQQNQFFQKFPPLPRQSGISRCGIKPDGIQLRKIIRKEISGHLQREDQRRLRRLQLMNLERVKHDQLSLLRRVNRAAGANLYLPAQNEAQFKIPVHMRGAVHHADDKDAKTADIGMLYDFKLIFHSTIIL